MGRGKSNLISYFDMLRAIFDRRLQLSVAKRGGANRVLTFGAKQTPQLSSEIKIDDTSYQFHLEQTDADELVFSAESITNHADGSVAPFQTGRTESRLRDSIAHGLLPELPGSQGYLSNLQLEGLSLS